MLPKFTIVSGPLLLMFGMAAGGAAQELIARPQPQQGVQAKEAPAPTAPSPTPVAPAKERALSHELEIPGSQQWTDTGIDVQPGDRIVISASGAVQNLQFGSFGPEGAPRTWRDLLLARPVHAAASGALVGRIGAEAAAVPFLVGQQKELSISSAGRLFLGINQNAGDSSYGCFYAKLQIVPAPVEAKAAAPSVLSVDPHFLEQIPRRVADSKGNPGDVVNFVILGSQEKVQQAFRDAGWVLVDRTVQEAALHAVLSSMNKESYVEMPMSELYLFGRPQDFGYARAEPISVVSTRHHLRLWRAPFDLNGETVWVGAGTHDVGFEKDQRTGGVTHKIDPEIDQEREFIAGCFKEAGRLSAFSYLAPSDPVHEASTATGGPLHTDGRVLIMAVGPVAGESHPQVSTSPPAK